MSSSVMNASDSVFGHYVQQGHVWEPLLSESSPLFRAVVNDDARAVEADLGADSSKAVQLFVLLCWGSRPNSDQTSSQTQSEDGSKPPVTVKQRTLLMIAAFHGSMRVLALLAVAGADPAVKSPDGLTASQLAFLSQRPEAATVAAYLKDAEQSLQVLRGQLDATGKMGLSSGTQFSSLECLPAGGVDISNPQVRGMWNIPPIGRQDSTNAGMIGNGGGGGGGGGGDPFSQDSLPYSTAELTKPEYSTDEFRMFCFKILRCCRRYAHDWRACPFAHPTENARRRDPREYKYCSIPCPDYKQGFCIRGDSCPHAHGVFECWLHPSKFRTQLCKDGNKCRRPVCFFSHSLTELRSPTHTWTPSADALNNPQGYQDQEQNVQVSHSTEKINTTASATVTNGEGTTHPHTVIKNEEIEEIRVSEVDPEDGQLLKSLEKSPSQEMLGSKDLSKKVQAARSAGLTPRMSNAFARKYGLDPKDGPTVNLQKLTGRHSTEPRPTSAFDRRSQSFDSRTVNFGRSSSSTRQRRTKQANHSALDSLNFSMNSFTFGGRPGSRQSLTDASFALAATGGSGHNPAESSPTATTARSLHHSHSTGEHLRSHSAILPDLSGSLDSSFHLLNAPSIGSASSFLGLQNYILGHSSSYTPGTSFSVPDPVMPVESVMSSDPTVTSSSVAPLALNAENGTTTTTTTT